jgi:hypothetical protein
MCSILMTKYLVSIVVQGRMLGSDRTMEFRGMNVLTVDFDHPGT